MFCLFARALFVYRKSMTRRWQGPGGCLFKVHKLSIIFNYEVELAISASPSDRYKRLADLKPQIDLWRQTWIRRSIVQYSPRFFLSRFFRPDQYHQCQGCRSGEGSGWPPSQGWRQVCHELCITSAKHSHSLASNHLLLVAGRSSWPKILILRSLATGKNCFRRLKPLISPSVSIISSGFITYGTLPSISIVWPMNFNPLKKRTSTSFFI